MKMRRICLLAALAVLAAASLPDTLPAAGGVPVAHGRIVRDYARITFEWPETVYLTANASGTRLSITFDRAADPNFGPLLAELSPYVTHAERKSDGKTVVLTLDRPYRIRTFVSDNINGVDLLDINAGLQHKAVAAASRKAAEKKIEPPPPPEKTERVEIAPSEPVPGPEEIAALSPAAGAEEMPAAAAEEKPAEPVVLAESPPPPAAPAEASPAAETPAATLPLPMASGDAAALLAGAPAQPEKSDKLKVGVSPSEDSAVLRFPFTERVAMAVFARARSLWIVFSKPMPLDLADFSALRQTVLGPAELIAHPQATVLRMPIDDGVYISATREENNFAWAVLLTPKKRAMPHALSPVINTAPPSPAHIFIPTLEMTAPIKLRDPQVGDELIVTPLYNPGTGVPLKRDFVEFTLLETAQGIAVNKRADEVAVVQLRNGLRISKPQGATLTPDLPEIKADTTASVSMVTLFPYELWKPENPDNIKDQVQGLFHRIVEAENPQEANNARLRLAQLYLAEGRAAEALGLLDGINRTNPSFYRSAKLNAMRGAAHFLMYRFPHAAHDLAAPELNNNKEIDYWRSMLADLLGNTEQSYDYLAMNRDYISKYPPLFRQRLAIVAADRSIATKEYNSALKIFDTLQQDNLLDPVNTYVNFLLAKISADTGQEKEAFEMWDRLANDYDHPFVQARAEFSRIAWGMDHNTLPKDQAIDRLERLRLAWHGDSLELKVLGLLGELYAERRDYINAMRIWNGGVISFPQTAASIDMSRKMQEAFIVMFNEGIADELPPLEALALYYEYRNYTPPGSTGNAMIERLADRLVAVDLLDQAAALLDHQMHFQVEKEQRSRLGVKLAHIYLLNHQPQKALTALQDSLYGENPLMLRLTRNRLTAQAMVDLGQPEKALSTLGSDNSVEAERIRMSVYWSQKDWAKLTGSIESMLKLRPDITAPITLEESEYLLKLALAYVFQNNSTQLAYLRDYFGPLMEKNPNKPVFDFITGGDIRLTTTNFDEVLKYLSDTRNFIENYSAHIKTPEPPGAETGNI